MDAWLLEATTAALERMKAHAALVDLSNTEEFTFRSFFMAALRERHPETRLQTEWNTIDLLVQFDPLNALVEFKYYIHRRTTGLEGRIGRHKGGASAKNEGEFWRCIQKLHTATHDPIHARYLVLVYERPADLRRGRTYHASYGQLSAGEFIAGITTIERDPLICKILELR